MTWPLIYSILLFYGILVLVNVPAPFLGLEFESGQSSKLWYAPPGYVIPIAWFVLFTLLGVARYNLLQTEYSSYEWWLFGLSFLCAAYAYYTLGFAKVTNISALWFGLFGNVLVILFAIHVVFKLLPVSTSAALLTMPIILWTIYASVIVFGEMKSDNLI